MSIHPHPGSGTRLVIIGGSDAGISAGLRARELDPASQVTVVVADAYPNFSICGIPYYVSGDVHPWQSLAHRTFDELEAAGLRLRVNTYATQIDVEGRRVALSNPDGPTQWLGYDELVVATGAGPAVPAIKGLGGGGEYQRLGPAQGVHLLHSMDDMFTLIADLDAARLDDGIRTAIIVGAGYIGLEMAEALRARGVAVTMMHRPAEVLATVDPELGALLRTELEANGVRVSTESTVTAISKVSGAPADRLMVTATHAGSTVHREGDIVLVVTGVAPEVDLLHGAAGARIGAGGAVVVDQTMATGLPHIWAAGDCVITHHRLLGTTYLPLGTTAHKQGRIAGANAVSTGDGRTGNGRTGNGRTEPVRFAGSLGTQVVKVFDLVAARTGLLQHEAVAAGIHPYTIETRPDDHKAYYPGAQPITIHLTADVDTGRLLGAQLVGRLGSEVAKRVDVYATALFHEMTVDGISDLDLSYTPRWAHHGTPCRWPRKSGPENNVHPAARHSHRPWPSDRDREN
jgi:NADPH-dependent 2,4-dienoyl-CoA reductase/sulfur reductase-like enzyme